MFFSRSSDVNIGFVSCCEKKTLCWALVRFGPVLAQYFEKHFSWSLCPQDSQHDVESSCPRMPGFSWASSQVPVYCLPPSSSRVAVYCPSYPRSTVAALFCDPAKDTSVARRGTTLS